MAGFNAARTHDNTAESTLTTSNVGQLVLRSDADLPNPGDLPTTTHLSPAFANGFMYVAGESGNVYVYDAAAYPGCGGDIPPECAPLWFGTVPASSQRSSPAVVNGTVYVGGNDGVYAFDASGKTNCATPPDKSCGPLRTYAAGGPVASSPAIVDGTLYVTAGAAGRTLYAFDASGETNCSGTPVSCTALWSASLGGVGSDPTVAAGSVYVGAANGRVYAFDAAGTTNCSGSPHVCSPLWTATLSGAGSVSTLAYTNGVLYGTLNGRLYAVDATGAGCSGTSTTCVPLWRSTISTRASAPAVANGIVYSATPAGVEAFDAGGHTKCVGAPTTCTPLWTAVGATSLTPAIANGVLYVGEQDGTLQAFDAAGATNCSGTPSTCQPLWSRRAGIIASGPVVANGSVTVRVDDETSVISRFVRTYAIVPPRIYAANLGHDGAVYVHGIQFPPSTSGVVAVTDEDQSNEVATVNITTFADGDFFATPDLPVWQCGDDISVTATVGTSTASDKTVLGCQTASS